MKYKIGDKVRIIPKPPTKTGKLNWAFGGMCLHCNEVVTITSVVEPQDGLTCYRTSASGGWTWKEDWLLPLSDFRIGDYVRIKFTGELTTYLGILTGEDKDLELVSRKQLI